MNGARQTYEYFLLFVKTAFTSKVQVFFILGFPLLYMIAANMHWFSEPPAEAAFTGLLVMFVTVQVFITGMQTVMNLVTAREGGFFKMFTFIAGRRGPVVFGQILAGYVFLLANTIVLAAVTGLMFGHFSFAVVLHASAVAALTMIPATLALSWILLLKLQQQSFGAVMSISIFAVLFITFNQVVTGALSIPFAFVNPAYFTYQIAMHVPGVEAGTPEVSIWILLTIGTVYLAGGAALLRRVPLTSSILRT
ncbi:hypothetical protein [Alteribacter natronophilus]|uniref:hypothetical protein n=1 Tax=Alteribacter natronophilus TaxID=2583810 RepID=UPI00110D2A15|nr:hypothetical protein [Alteribacter natronophilus]TMW70429.1 hypothetical protein FGB90_17335 [Alteribacter natronophilus]